MQGVVNILNPYYLVKTAVVRERVLNTLFLLFRSIFAARKDSFFFFFNSNS